MHSERQSNSGLLFKRHESNEDHACIKLAGRRAARIRKLMAISRMNKLT